MATIILCRECGKKAKLHGRGLCVTCYQSLFRTTHIFYFQAYRSRPEYREQRLQYDLQYAKNQARKEEETQKKRE